MGALRYLLAVMVLASHAQVIHPFAGSLAVEVFFTISGFYIQMILWEQYANQHHWKRKFWQSRALRIFVPYWVVCGIVFCTQLVFSEHRPQSPIPLWSLWIDQAFSSEALALLMSNITIVGIDIIKLFRITEGCNYILWSNIIIQPVWSIGIELVFYAMAPYILQLRTRILLLIIATCIAAKSVLYAGHVHHIFYALPCADGLLNGIFPLEIGVFLAGAIGYRFTKNHIKTGHTIPVSYNFLVCAILVLSIISSISLDYVPMLGFQAYLMAMIALIPVLYIASRNNSMDRAIGELSYPFYLSHYFMLTITHKWGFSGLTSFIIALLLSTLCASLMVRFIEIPLNQYRHRHFRKS